MSTKDDILNDQNLKVTNYFKALAGIHEMFGYREDWRSFPLEDCRDYYWKIEDDEVYYSEDEFTCTEDSTYSSPVYTYRHLNKYVYTTSELTMVLVDTQCDFNIFLMIFSNEKKVL